MGDPRRRDSRGGVRKGGVRQAVAEREKGFCGIEEVAAHRRGLVVVKEWQLPDATREADRELAARVHVTEQYLGHRGPALLSQIPTLQDGRGPFGQLRDRRRAA